MAPYLWSVLAIPLFRMLCWWFYHRCSLFGYQCQSISTQETSQNLSNKLIIDSEKFRNLPAMTHLYKCVELAQNVSQLKASFRCFFYKNRNCTQWSRVCPHDFRCACGYVNKTSKCVRSYFQTTMSILTLDVRNSKSFSLLIQLELV